MRFFLALFIFWTLSLDSIAQNLQKDITLGKQYSEYIEREIGIYENPELRDYIEAIGDKLTAQMDEPLFDYKYTILATPEPNAFSIPGGYLYITTGMFPFLESEDELACIMAHEIIHANNRHVIKSNRKGIIPGILQIPGAIIGLVIDENIGNAINSPFRQIGALTHASYNRKQETEADLKGLEIASKAGYDPDALKSILSRIGKYGEIEAGASEEKDPYASHPMTADRIAKIDKIKEKLDCGNRSQLAEDFFGLFDGVLTGANPTNGNLIDSLFVNSNANFKIVFPEDWELAFKTDLIVGVNSEKREMMQVRFEETELDPDTAALNFLNVLNPYVKESVLGSESILVNDKKGHIVAFREKLEDNTYYGFRIWVREGKNLFNFVAVSLDEDQTKMQNIVYSLSDLEPEDLALITMNRLKIVQPLENETLPALSERTANDLSEEITRLINEIPKGKELESDEKIKVIVKEQLFPN